MAFSLALTQAMYVSLLLRDKVELGRYDFVPAGVISQALGIPKPSVVKILKNLTQAGIVVTGAGVTGGARLADGAGARTLYDLFVAIEGRQPLFRNDHVIPSEGPRPDEARALVARTLGSVEQAFVLSLQGIPLATLVAPGLPDKSSSHVTKFT